MCNVARLRIIPRQQVLTQRVLGTRMSQISQVQDLWRSLLSVTHLPKETWRLESGPESPHGKIAAMALAFFLEVEAGGCQSVADQPA